MDHNTELLAPAGSYEGFEAALGAGADAVYVGGAMFGARAYAQNFDKEELLRAIDTAHLHGKKLYLTVNTLLKNRELKEQLPEYLAPYYEAGLDAVIVQDMGVFSLIKEQFPGLHLHASTQMTVTGPDGMRNVTRQNNSETSGFDRGRCVLTSSCRDTALAAAWIDQMYAPLQSPQNNWGTYGEKDSFNIFELSKNKDGGEMLKHMDLGTQSPVEVREAQSVNGPLAVLNEYYDVYVTQPEDAKWRLDNMHETYLQDMNSKYVYPNVFMSIDDTNKVSQYDTDIKKYAEQKKADWILNGGIEKEWDSYLEKMEQYGLSDYLSIKQKYFDQYQESLSEEK